MAPHLQTPSRSSRKRAWLVTALALCCALAGHGHSWAAAEAGTSKSKKRTPTPTRTRASAEITQPAPAPARVLPVYACQDAAGRTSYGQQPCTNPAVPTSRQLAWRDTREASQVAHSAHMQSREHKLLQSIERNRQREAPRTSPARRPREHHPDDASTKTQAPTDRSPRHRASPLPTRYRALPPLTAEATEQSRLKP